MEGVINRMPRLSVTQRCLVLEVLDIQRVEFMSSYWISELTSIISLIEIKHPPYYTRWASILFFVVSIDNVCLWIEIKASLNSRVIFVCVLSGRCLPVFVVPEQPPKQLHKTSGTHWRSASFSMNNTRCQKCRQSKFIIFICCCGPVFWIRCPSPTCPSCN